MRRSLPVMLVVAALGLLGPGLMASPRAAAADMLSVHAWIQVGSTRPAVGCAVPVSVEVRASGNAVTQSEVAVALFIGDDVVSADRSVTDGDGVAYLTLDTSVTAPGSNGWVDVNVAGAYVTGFSLLPKSGGGCTSGGKLIEAEGVVPNVTAAAPLSGNVGGFVTYTQQRNLSCEYAALQIATTAWGNGISEYAFDGMVGWSANPHNGYRGNITGSWGNTSDYGVYAQPLAWALASFGFYGDVFYAQGDSSQLTARLDNGVPTLVWIGLWGDQSHYETGADGATYLLVAGMHVVVAYDYDEGGVYASDPAIGSTTYYSWGDFMYMWNVLDGMGLGVSPA